MLEWTGLLFFSLQETTRPRWLGRALYNLSFFLFVALILEQPPSHSLFSLQPTLQLALCSPRLLCAICRPSTGALSMLCLTGPCGSRWEVENQEGENSSLTCVALPKFWGCPLLSIRPFSLLLRLLWRRFCLPDGARSDCCKSNRSSPHVIE